MLDVGNVPQAMHKINTAPYLITGLLTDITKAPAMQVPYVALFPLCGAYRKKTGKKSNLSKVERHESHSISAVIHRNEYYALTAGEVYR